MPSEDIVRVTPGTARCLAECDSASAHGIEDTPFLRVLLSGAPIKRFPSRLQVRGSVIQDFLSGMKTSVNSTVERFVAFAGRFHFHATTPSFRGRFPLSRRRVRTRRARDCESRLRAPGSNVVLDTRPLAVCHQASPRRPRGSSRPNPTRRENTRFADLGFRSCKPRPLPRSFHKPRRRDGRSGNARKDVSRRGATWCVPVVRFSTRVPLAYPPILRRTRADPASRSVPTAFFPTPPKVPRSP